MDAFGRTSTNSNTRTPRSVPPAYGLEENAEHVLLACARFNKHHRKLEAEH